MASQSCAFCALSPSLSPSPLPTPSRALGSTKPPAPKWQRWVLGFGLGLRNLRPCSRGYRAIRARSSENPEGSDSAPPAAGIPKGSEQKRGKAPRNRRRVPQIFHFVCVFFCCLGSCSSQRLSGIKLSGYMCEGKISLTDRSLIIPDPQP